MRLPAVLWFAGIASLAITAACSNQGEGEFCDPLAGVTGGDCQDGLKCVSAPGVAAVSGNTYRCCPTQDGTGTTPACMTSNQGPDASTEVVVASSDAASETAPGADGGVAAEAAADSPSQSDADSRDAATDATLADGASESGTEAGATSDASDASHE